MRCLYGEVHGCYSFSLAAKCEIVLEKKEQLINNCRCSYWCYSTSHCTQPLPTHALLIMLNRDAIYIIYTTIGELSSKIDEFLAVRAQFNSDHDVDFSAPTFG